MIIREIMHRTDEVIARFDHFNDYSDTRQYLEGLIAQAEAVLAKLEADHARYRQHLREID